MPRALTKYFDSMCHPVCSLLWRTAQEFCTVQWQSIGKLDITLNVLKSGSSETMIINSSDEESHLLSLWHQKTSHFPSNLVSQITKKLHLNVEPLPDLSKAKHEVEITASGVLAGYQPTLNKMIAGCRICQHRTEKGWIKYPKLPGHILVD